MDYQNDSPQLSVEDKGVDSNIILRFINKWKLPIIIGAVLFGVLAAVWSNYFLHPVYQATSVLMVREPSSQASSSGNIPDNKQTMDTYLAQLNSDEIRQMMVKDLGLDYTPGGISVKAADNNLINIGVENRDPKLAADIANSLGKQFLILLAEKKHDQVVEPIKTVSKPAAADNAELQTAREALEEFQRTHRGAAALEQEISRKAETVASLEADLEQSKSDLAKLQADMVPLEKEIKSTPRGVMKQSKDPVTGKVIDDWEPNPGYTSLYQQYVQREDGIAAKEKEIMSLNQRIGKSSAELKSLQSELTDFKFNLDKLQQDVDRSDQAEAPAVKKPPPEISQPLQPDKAFVTIYRKAAVPTNPTVPGRIPIILLGVLAGTLLSTSMALLVEKIGITIKTPEDVEISIEVPTVGVIPPDVVKSAKSKKAGKLDLAVYRRPNSEQAEAYRALGDKLEQICEEESCRSIMVTSPGYSDGKASVAASLAVVLAKAGHRVMLIDGDLRKPIMHKLFNWDNRRGFSNSIMEDLLPEGYASRTLVDSLSVMTSGPRLISPTDLLVSPKVSVIIGVLQKNYDYLIFNSPPVLEGSDALILADKVEGVLLVLGSGRTKKKHAVEAYKQLEMVKARVVGVVID